MAAVIRAGGLRGYRELVRELGGRPETLLLECRIDPATLDDEDNLVPLHAQARLLEITAGAVGLGDFGRRLGHRQDIGILGPLAMAMQHAPTAGEALHCASQRLFVQSQAVGLSIVARGSLPADPLELRVALCEPRLGPSRQFMDQCLAVLDRVARFLAPDHYTLLSVSLDHSPLAPVRAYRSSFGAPVHVAQPQAALFIEHRFLDTPLRTVNAVLRKMAFDYLDSRYGHPDQPVTARVRLVLEHSMGSVNATRQHVARTLAMHPRTLQRHLAREGASFDTVRDDVRRQTTLRYLHNSRLSMTQIAALIGLSQSSALTRCCLRWFAQTPSAIRGDPDAPLRATPPATMRDL